MSFWISLWQALFFITIALFSVVTVWVTVQGALDIKHLMQMLKLRHENTSE